MNTSAAFALQLVNPSAQIGSINDAPFIDETGEDFAELFGALTQPPDPAALATVLPSPETAIVEGDAAPARAAIDPEADQPAPDALAALPPIVALAPTAPFPAQGAILTMSGGEIASASPAASSAPPFAADTAKPRVHVMQALLQEAFAAPATPGAAPPTPGVAPDDVPTTTLVADDQPEGRPIAKHILDDAPFAAQQTARKAPSLAEPQFAPQSVGGDLAAPPDAPTFAAMKPEGDFSAAVAAVTVDPSAPVAPPRAPVVSAIVAAPASLSIVDSVEAPDGSIELRLDPPDLGRVVIEIARDDQGAVRAVISAERAETLDFVRRHIDIFKDELSRHGLGDIAMSFDDRQRQGRDADQRSPKSMTHWSHFDEAGFDGAMSIMATGAFDVFA